MLDAKLKRRAAADMDLIHDTRSAIQLEEQQEQRTNFPVPPEIRNQIYGYLLSSEFVRTGNTYRFHTNTLAVNRTIHEEAQYFLLKHNIFILVDIRWCPDGWAFVNYIPTVTNRKEAAEKFRHPSMRLGLHCTIPSDMLEELDESDLNRTPIARTFLILERDLRLLCQVFACKLHIAVGPVPVVVSSIKESFTMVDRLYRQMAGAPVTTIELCDTERRSIDNRLQSTLLEPCRALISMKHTVTVGGKVTDPTHCTSITSSMDCSLVWALAKKWAFIETVYAIKQHCNEKLLKGIAESIRAEYPVLLDSASRLTSGPETDFFFPDCAGDENANLAMHIWLFDTYATLAWHLLSLGDLDQVGFFADRLEKLIRDCPNIEACLAPDTYTGACTLIWLRMLHDPNYVWTMPKARLIVLFEGYLKENKQDIYLHHDLSVLKETGSLNSKPDAGSLPINECSAYKLPMRIFDSTARGKVPRKPDHIVGWQDVSHLRLLSKEEKDSVNEFLDLHGEEPVDFD